MTEKVKILAIIERGKGKGNFSCFATESVDGCGINGFGRDSRETIKDMQVAVSNVLRDHGLPPVTEDDVRYFMGQGSKVTMGKAFAKYGKTLDDPALTEVTREFVRYYEADPISNTTAFAGPGSTPCTGIIVFLCSPPACYDPADTAQISNGSCIQDLFYLLI